MKNHHYLSLFIILWMAPFSMAQGLTDYLAKADDFFQTHVANGRVDYAQISASPNTLNQLVATAAEIKVSKAEATAYQSFLINTYNLLVIKGVVDHYPLKSPLDVPGFFDKKTYAVSGEAITLNTLENEWLRGVFPKEARFHFVLVCAGIGCPPLIDKAYTPDALEDQLQRQTQKALNDSLFIRVKKNKIGVSQLFDWYKEDFLQYGSITEFINRYRNEQLPEKGKVVFYPYDWRLNDLP